MPIKDATAGLICYRKKVLLGIPLDKIQSVGYGFQVEMKFLAHQYGFSLQEISIIFTNRVRGVSKMSKGIILEALWQVIRMKVSSIFK